MIEQLRIQCPSCGIILDVRNSKHEAVKRITCPHCKKQMNVNFQEEEQKPTEKPTISFGDLYHGEMRITLHEGVNKIPLPAFDALVVRVVRLNDGNSKCIVSLADKRQSVLVNGEPLGPDDAVSLAVGDELFSHGAVLTYGRPGRTTAGQTKKPKAEKPKPRNVVPPLPVKAKRPPLWVFALLSALIAVCALWYFWPEKSKPTVVEDLDEVVDSVKPTIVEKVKPSKPSRPTHSESKAIPKKATAPKVSSPTSDYELEQMALKGDVNAQYELGNRLVHKGGTNNIIRGIKYLRLASNNGSSKARTVLGKAINRLQEKAGNGDSVAYHILRSIEN